MMKNKVFSIICMLLFIMTASIPTMSAQQTINVPTPIFNKMAQAHIKIDGSGSSFIIASTFVLGFGRCVYMRLKLDESSHIEINKLMNKTNQVVLDGSQIVTLFGFIGYYKEKDNSINLNGFVVLVYWK